MTQYEQNNFYVINTMMKRRQRMMHKRIFNAGFLSAIRKTFRIFFLEKSEGAADSTFQVNL